MHRTAEVIGLVGDVHGNLATATRAIRKLTAKGVTEIHFLGDFSFLWRGGEGESVILDMLSHSLTNHGALAYVTGGNHEGYDEWALIPSDADAIKWPRPNIALLPRGWRATSPTGNVIASLGGANSIDMPARIEGNLGYWEAEQITEADLAALGSAKVDVLLGHDAPKSVALLERLKAKEHLWDQAGLAYAHAGHDMFHRAVTQVQPRLTVSGHYHQHLDVIETFAAADGTPFEARMVILNADGAVPTIALLNTDALTVMYPKF